METSPHCRILVLSEKVETSRQLVNRIRECAGDSSDPCKVQQNTLVSDDCIFWNIRNKYYSALVHFLPVSLEDLGAVQWDRVPAVIYSWREEEPFKDHIERISEYLSSYSPEVALAVSSSTSSDEGLDDFFFEYGFEFVKDTSTSLGSSDEPGLRRIVDALSVIMWPTMNRLETVPSIHVSGSIIDTFLGSRMGNLMLEPGTIPLPGISRRDREMEALETWLNDDVIQASSSSPKSKIDSAWVVRRSFESPSESTEHSDLSDGFDDDFSDFISAPTPQNLQNVDSFESEFDDLPSHEEIIETSARLFGSREQGRPSTSRPSDFLDESLTELGTELGLVSSVSDPSSPVFDLSRILQALQNMKEEIAGMEDENERRKAAAKAALGLAYVLDQTDEEL